MSSTHTLSLFDAEPVVTTFSDAENRKAGAKVLRAHRRPLDKTRVCGDTSVNARKLEADDLRQAVTYAVWLAARDGVTIPAACADDLQRALQGFAQESIVTSHVVATLHDGKRAVRATAVHFRFKHRDGAAFVHDVVTINLPNHDFDPTLPAVQLDDEPLPPEPAKAETPTTVPAADDILAEITTILDAQPDLAEIFGISTDCPLCLLTDCQFAHTFKPHQPNGARHDRPQPELDRCSRRSRWRLPRTDGGRLRRRRP